MEKFWHHFLLVTTINSSKIFENNLYILLIEKINPRMIVRTYQIKKIYFFNSG